MKYGLSRAVPMGIFGFLIGMFVAFLLRAWQGLDPTWDPEVGIVLGAIFGSILFVGSMGAFDPAMSAHGEEGHDEEGHGEEAHAHAAEEPTVGWIERAANFFQAGTHRILSWITSGAIVARVIKFIILLIPLILFGLGWGTLRFLLYCRAHLASDVFYITSITLTILLLIAIVALIPHGPGIIITNDPLGAPAGNGYFTFNFFGTEFVFTKLAFFAIFVIWTVVSLAIAGGVIALLMSFLAREVRSVKGKAPSPEALTPPAPLRLFSRGASWLLNRLPEPPKPQR